LEIAGKGWGWGWVLVNYSALAGLEPRPPDLSLPSSWDLPATFISLLRSTNSSLQLMGTSGCLQFGIIMKKKKMLPWTLVGGFSLSRWLGMGKWRLGFSGLCPHLRAHFFPTGRAATCPCCMVPSVPQSHSQHLILKVRSFSCLEVLPLAA
jgi:hypothetical protein